MIVALAEWKGRVSPVFDVSRHILVLAIRDGVIVERREEYLDEEEPLGKAKRLASMEIDHLICGAISRPLAGLLTAYGIRTITFVAGDVEEVIKAFLSDLLPDPAMAMPGCCGRNNRFRACQGWHSTNSQSGQDIKQGRPSNKGCGRGYKNR